MHLPRWPTSSSIFLCSFVVKSYILLQRYASFSTACSSVVTIVTRPPPPNVQLVAKGNFECQCVHGNCCHTWSTCSVWSVIVGRVNRCGRSNMIFLPSSKCENDKKMWIVQHERSRLFTHHSQNISEGDICDIHIVCIAIILACWPLILVLVLSFVLLFGFTEARFNFMMSLFWRRSKNSFLGDLIMLPLLYRWESTVDVHIAFNEQVIEALVHWELILLLYLLKQFYYAHFWEIGVIFGHSKINSQF